MLKDHIVYGRRPRCSGLHPLNPETRDSCRFLVGQHGILDLKDCGKHCGTLAAALTEDNPGDGWTRRSRRL
jgi:hypothetical protein